MMAYGPGCGTEGRDVSSMENVVQAMPLSPCMDALVRLGMTDPERRAKAASDLGRPIAWPAASPGRRDPRRRRGRHLPAARRLALPGRLGGEPVLGVGATNEPPGPRAEAAHGSGNNPAVVCRQPGPVRSS
jgi:hypothetical protein